MFKENIFLAVSYCEQWPLSLYVTTNESEGIVHSFLVKLWKSFLLGLNKNVLLHALN
jgi:hypothetical protein